jgi:hypothetical protein
LLSLPRLKETQLHQLALLGQAEEAEEIKGAAVRRQPPLRNASVN